MTLTKKYLLILCCFMMNLSFEQSYDWGKDGYRNFSKGGIYKDIDGSAIDIKVSGLYKDEKLKSQVYVKTGSNNQLAEGLVHTYKFVFSEKVDLMFTISDINHSETKNCFNDYMVFSGQPLFSDMQYLKIVNDSIVVPDLSKEFKANGKVNIQYFQTDTIVIQHGKGEGCNPGFIYISPLRINQNNNYDSLKLSNVLFDSGKSEIRASHFEMLDKLSEFIKENPSAKLSICGYTDSIGDVSDNLILSKDRVESVIHYLHLKDVAPNNIIVRGFGEAQPAKSNETEIGRQLNRRVEIQIKD